MKIRCRSKTLAAGTTVALATAGLSSCNDNGAVDPPPPPLECNTVDNGETLTATATVTGRELRISIRNASSSSWVTAATTLVGGGTARPVTLGEPLVVVIDLDDGVTGGSFTLSGVLRGFNGERCPVTRRFTFTIGSGGVVVASALDLPLPARQQARVTLVARDGHDVELEASTPFGGAQTITWSVTGGAMISQDGPRLRWRLPREPGLYQVELLVDYGPRGLSFDTLALEVI